MTDKTITSLDLEQKPMSELVLELAQETIVDISSKLKQEYLVETHIVTLTSSILKLALSINENANSKGYKVSAY